MVIESNYSPINKNISNNTNRKLTPMHNNRKLNVTEKAAENMIKSTEALQV